MRYFSIVFLLLTLWLEVSCQKPAYTVVTYNIRLDTPADGPNRWKKRKKALVKTLKSQKPDIIGLQEVLLNQLEYLEKHLKNYARVGVGRDDGHEKGEFSPIFYDSTRFRILESQMLWLSETPDVPSVGWDAALPRIATFVSLEDKKSGERLWVVNTHFDHKGEVARLKSAELLQKRLSKPPPKTKLILMGDFNATPDAAPITFLQTHFQETCPPEKSGEGTFNGFDVKRTEFRRIDYIWLSPGDWDLVFYDVPRSKTWRGRWVSDHFLVVVRVSPKPM